MDERLKTEGKTAMKRMQSTVKKENIVYVVFGITLHGQGTSFYGEKAYESSHKTV